MPGKDHSIGKPRLIGQIVRGLGYRIIGPADIHVLEGRVTVLGAEYTSGARFSIPEYRSYFVAGLEDSSIEVRLGVSARLEQPGDGEEPLFNWIEAVDSLLDECKPPCKIVFVGPTDSGKTSLSLLVSNRSLLHGYKPALIDLDIGQADIGAPAFASIAFPENWVIWMRKLSSTKSVFIGHIEPAHAEGRIAYAARRLIDFALESSADTIIVDTDGWVTGWRALEYKLDLMRVIGADYIVVVGSRELASFFEARWPGRILFLESPKNVVVRSIDTRRRLRQENYKRYLEGGVERVFPLDRVKLVNACIPSAFSSPLEEDVPSAGGKRVLLAGYYPGGLCVLLDTDELPEPSLSRRLAEELGVQEVMVLTRGGLRGVLVGLMDPEGWDHPGLLVDIDLESGLVRVKTKYEGVVRGIWVSRIRLSESYSDVMPRRVWI